MEIKAGQIPAIFNEPFKLTAKVFHMGTKVTTKVMSRKIVFELPSFTFPVHEKSN